MSGEIVTQPNGTQGLNFYGVRKTDKERTSFHWTDQVERQLELQLDGDVDGGVIAVDFNDDSKQILPAGSLILEAKSYSTTGGTVTNTAEDAQANMLALPAVAAGANAWVVVRDIDGLIQNDSQLSVTGLAAGEKMKVFLRICHPAEGDGTGVLDRP